MEPVRIASNGQDFQLQRQRSAAVSASVPPGLQPDSAGLVPKNGPGRTDAGAQAARLPEDTVNLSAESRQAGQSSNTDQAAQDRQKVAGAETTASGKSIEDPQVQQLIDRLKAIEEKVKAHESAHKSAGGSLSGAVSYSYTQGPDGRNYITGGEVQIDMSAGRTPQETVSKMQQVIRAALAPADPSAQDRAVAAQAASQLAQAQQQKMQAENPTAEAGAAEQVDPTQQENGQQGSRRDEAAIRARQAYADPAVRQQPPDSLAPSGQSGQQRNGAERRSAENGVQPLSSYA